ncbi:MAG: molybdopterin-binding protein, partial [Hyphomicrobiaceae bacterium]
GGASVGDHDLVVPALQAAGMTLDFWRIAMRPGKPLIFGRRGEQRVIGVPGNPVSSLICTRVFVVPLIAHLLGETAAAPDRPTPAIVTGPLEANGPRRHYMRATTIGRDGGRRLVQVVPSQDSSLLSPLAAADCLIVREPQAGAAAAGDEIAVLDLDF